MESDLRHADKSGQLCDLIYAVRGELKAGWSEKIYHQVLLETLQENGIPVVTKKRHTLFHRQTEVYMFEPDLFVWDLIILELKALPYQDKFTGEQIGQVIQYLKFLEKDLGLLVNFSPPRTKIKRVIWDEPEVEIHEDFERIKNDLSEVDRIHLRKIRHHILSVARQYGLGFSEIIYRKIIAIEMAYQGISCLPDIEIPSRWRGKIVANHLTHHLLVADNYLVHVRASLDYPPAHDFHATKTYLSSLGLRFGLVVNFGREQLQIFGVQTN